MANNRWGRGLTKVFHFVGTLSMSVLAAVPGYAGSEGWTRTTLDEGPVSILVVDPQQPSVLYAGTGGAGVFKSTDGEEHWVARSEGLIEPARPAIATLAVSPQVPALLYAGTRDAGVFRSRNGGSEWQPSNVGLTHPFAMAVAMDPWTPTTLYVGTYDGLFKSIDAGETWSLLSTCCRIRLVIHPWC